MEEVTPSQTISYVTVDAATGRTIGLFSVPRRLLPKNPRAGEKIVIVTDGNLPAHTQYLLKLDMLPEPVTYVEQLADIIAANEMPAPKNKADLEAVRAAGIRDLDLSYAERMASMTGPLSTLHAEKRRQAEAGGGPLVANEADRLAILENAERQDSELAEMESERRAIKARLRNATTEEEIAAALDLMNSKNRSI